MSMPGPPHIEPPRWAGQTSHSGASTRSFSCSDRKIHGRPHAPRSQDQAGHVVDEQRIAREDRPGLVAAGAVDQGKGRVLGAMARACEARGSRARRPRARSRRRTARARRRARRGDGCGSSRRLRLTGDRDRRRGRRGCGSRGCDRSRRRSSLPAPGTPSVSRRGSTTAAVPACSSPIRYEAQPRCRG